DCRFAPSGLARMRGCALPRLGHGFASRVRSGGVGSAACRRHRAVPPRHRAGHRRSGRHEARQLLHPAQSRRSRSRAGNAHRRGRARRRRRRRRGADLAVVPGGRDGRPGLPGPRTGRAGVRLVLRRARRGVGPHGGGPAHPARLERAGRAGRRHPSG
ncbi:MAG: putative phosphohistidine phosphatase, SixA, partial [uncultured Craurococcus sp.]